MKLETRRNIIRYSGAFFLGYSLCGIFGFIDGVMLACAIICMFQEMLWNIQEIYKR